VTSRLVKRKATSPGVPAAVRDFVRERYAEKSGTLEITALTGDASTRRYFRLTQGPKTRVLTLYPEPFDPAELTFGVVRGLLSGYGLPVPEVLDVDGARSILVQEDLGDMMLQEILRDAEPAERAELYREAVDQLVQLQVAAARGPQKAPCFHVAFDIEKLSWELHYFEKHFLEGLRARDLGVEDRATLAEGFHRLAAEIASWPRVLCHRDFHSRNLMRHHGVLYWIDFQDARMGPATYDLASLLRDSYVELSDEFVAERAEEFRQRALPGESRDAFARRFDLTSVQRNLKALGTFGYMASVRQNPVYLQYIPRTLQSARRNLERHPELAGLLRILSRHVEELQ
jgi:aminoglycoside/choline kinase family phosphotransferase